MKITFIDKEIKKVFETGYYSIPSFQRPYSWEKDHISEFLNDTLIDNESTYFIGSIVLYKKTNETYGIVDGQQRLTTITMILCALRNSYKNAGFDDNAQGVHSLIEKINLDNKKTFILQTETSYPYFQEHIQKYSEPEINVDLGSEEINLKNGYDQISSYINSEINNIRNNPQNAFDLQQHILTKLNEIRDKLLKLNLIYIELDEEDDAYIIFETLNTRGKDLSVGDLLKNYLTKHIKAENSGIDVPKEKWTLIRENIEATSADLNIDTFLLHVWLSKYDFTTAKILFKKIKSTIKGPQSKAFLDSLVTDSATYKSIFDTDTRKWIKTENTIRNSLSALYGFRVTQQTPMVLAIMREYNNKNLKFKYAQEALEAIEHFHFIFTAITSQRSSGSIGTMYSTYGRKLSAAKDDTSRLNLIRELKQKMREQLPTFDEFLASFKTIKYTNIFTKQKKIIQYTLIKVDKFNNKKGVPINYDLMTLEHILPQNPKAKNLWHDQNVGLIGNLIQVDEHTNTLLDNKAFADKKLILDNSNIFIDNIIQKARKWEDVEIQQRTEYLAKLSYNNVFKI